MEYPVVKLRKKTLISLVKGQRRWTVFVFEVQLRHSPEQDKKDLWAKVTHENDPDLRDAWVNLGDYTQVTGGGAAFTRAQMAALQAAEPQPQPDPCAGMYERLRDTWLTPNQRMRH